MLFHCILHICIYFGAQCENFNLAFQQNFLNQRTQFHHIKTKFYHVTQPTWQQIELLLSRLGDVVGFYILHSKTEFSELDTYIYTVALVLSTKCKDCTHSFLCKTGSCYNVTVITIHYSMDLTVSEFLEFAIASQLCLDSYLWSNWQS